MTESKPKRQHKATFSRDKRKGGYLIRIEGPYANRFSNREVPVTLKSGEEKPHTLDSLIWAGKDKESGKPVALYSFIPVPKEESEEILF